MTTTPIAPIRVRELPPAPSRAPRRKGRVAVAVALLLVLAGSEAAARVLAKRLPEPRDWKQREAGLLVQKMQQVAATEGGADVVFLGSSVASFGFEPDVLAARTGLRAHNASLPGSSLLSLERWTEEMVVPILKPRVAVIAITSRDVNDAGAPQRENLEQYLGSGERKRMLGIESATERAERAIDERVALVRLRRYLRRPASVARELRGVGSLERNTPFGAHGEPRFPEADFAYDETPGRRAWELDALRGFSTTKNFAALDRMIGWLRAHGVTPVLVEMPVVEDVYMPYHPHGRADYDAFRAALTARASAYGVPYVKAGPRDRSAFVDSIHLNRRGARDLTAELAARLRELRVV